MLTVRIGEIRTQDDTRSGRIDNTCSAALNLSLLHKRYAVNGYAVSPLGFDFLGGRILWSRRGFCYDFTCHSGSFAVNGLVAKVWRLQSQAFLFVRTFNYLKQ